MHKLPLIFIFPFILTIDHCLWVDGFNTILPQRQTISAARELHPTGPCKESPQGNPPVIFVQRCTPQGYKNPPLFPVPNRSPKPFASRSILFLVLSSISRPPKDMSLPWSHIALDFGSSSFFDVFECTSMSVDPRTCRYDTNSNKIKSFKDQDYFVTHRMLLHPSPDFFVHPLFLPRLQRFLSPETVISISSTFLLS